MPNRILSCPKIGIYPIHRVSGNIKNAQGRPAGASHTGEAHRRSPAKPSHTGEAHRRSPAETCHTGEAHRRSPAETCHTGEAHRRRPAEICHTGEAHRRSPAEPRQRSSATPAGLRNRCKHRFFQGFFVNFDKIEGGSAQANQKTGAFICQCARVLLFLPATKLSTTAYGPNSI